MSAAFWQYDDGGRAAAGFRGRADDCVTRAIAIAAELPYQDVYDAVNLMAEGERPRNGRKRSSARTGVQRATTRKVMAALGWRWTPTMGIGQGCMVHLLPEELPAGRLVCQLSKHLVAVIDGTVRDTDPDVARDGTRCVYGYWTPRA